MEFPSIKYGVVAVLSVDGGGVRGLIPAMVFRDLVRRVNFLRVLRGKSGDVCAHELFDLVAGTSTGALLVLGLTKRRHLRPEEIEAVYRREAAVIFPPKRFASVLAVRQAFAQKYETQSLQNVFHRLFGDERLSECRSNVLVAAYDTDNRAPFFFKHFERYDHHAKEAVRAVNDPPDDYYLRDVARATTAAPTYFEPAHVRSLSGKTSTLIDGGLVANNPALNAYVEARRLYPNARRYIIVSLGTGRSGRQFPFSTIRHWGYLDWVSPVHGVPVTSMMWDGQSESVAYSLKSVPRIEYFRFNADLGRVSEDMDDARPENMRRVEELGRSIIRSSSAELHRLAKMLSKERRLTRRG